MTGGTLAGVLPVFYSRRRMVPKTLSSGLYAPELFKDHEERTAVILGSGPSLNKFDFSRLARPDLFVFAINDEGHRNRDAFTPDAWIFYDRAILERYWNADVPEETLIFTTQPNFVGAFRDATPERPIPGWIHRAYMFTVCRHLDLKYDHLMMHRTTASAATTLAIKMGFKRIGLLGVDLYSKDDQYYYIPDTMPRRLVNRAKSYFAEGLYMEPRHTKMLFDMGKIKEACDAHGWDGEIVQTSTESPLDCFKKETIDEFLRCDRKSEP